MSKAVALPWAATLRGNRKATNKPAEDGLADSKEQDDAKGQAEMQLPIAEVNGYGLDGTPDEALPLERVFRRDRLGGQRCLDHPGMAKESGNKAALTAP